jgi:hypothetical protein
MAREYRIECGQSLDRIAALEKLVASPYFRVPSSVLQEGEVWLSFSANQNYADVRVFVRPFGFFLEITSLPKELATSLADWIAELQDSGECSIIDNDTAEMVTVVR